MHGHSCGTGKGQHADGSPRFVIGQKVQSGEHQQLHRRTQKKRSVEVKGKTMRKICSAVDVICLLGRRRARTELGGMRFPQLVFSDLRPGGMFWHLLPAPVLGGRAYGLPPLSAEEWMGKKLLFDEETEGTWAHELDINVGWERPEADDSEANMEARRQG